MYRVFIVVLLGVVVFLCVIAGWQHQDAVQAKQSVMELSRHAHDTEDAKAELESQLTGLQEQDRFYKSAYKVDYHRVMAELADLSGRQATGEQIPFADVKSVVVDIQHVYSVLNQRQSDALGKAHSDLFYGTTMMDAYPSGQADEVWRMIGAVQWREERD